MHTTMVTQGLAQLGFHHGRHLMLPIRILSQAGMMYTDLRSIAFVGLTDACGELVFWISTHSFEG